MENRVGSKVPSVKEVEKILDDLRAIQQRILVFTILLKAEERARTTKPRTGGDPIIAMIGELATQHGVVLPNISVDDMTADVELGQRLAPIQSEVELLLRRIQDTRLEAASEAWWAATAFYTVLARMAASSPALEQALQPIVEFFKRGRRAKAAAKPNAAAPAAKE